MCTVPAKKRSHFKYVCVFEVVSPCNFLRKLRGRSHVWWPFRFLSKLSYKSHVRNERLIFLHVTFYWGSGRWKKNKPSVSHDTSNYCRINCRPCYVAVWYQFSLNCCNCTFLVRCNRQVTYISMCSQMIGRKDRQYDTVHSTTFLR